MLAGFVDVNDNLKIGGYQGQVWGLLSLDERENDDRNVQYCRKLLGDFEVVCASVPMRVQIVPIQDKGWFVFAGVLRQTQRAMKVWFIEKYRFHSKSCVSTMSLELNHWKDGKLRGFCQASLLNQTEDGNEYQFRVACGLGIGKAHIWKFCCNLNSMSITQVYEGSLSTRRNSISTLMFYDHGNKLASISGDDGAVQLWEVDSYTGEQPFTKSSGLGRSSSISELRTLLSQEAVDLMECLFKEFNLCGQGDYTKEIVSSEQWSFLFPILKPWIEEDAPETPDNSDLFRYEGDLDLHGKASGYGVAYFQNSQLYDGEWIHGQKHGIGSLIDESTGVVLYNGTWKRNLKDGYGIEIGGDESYEGGFHAGSRNGFGKVSILQKKKLYSYASAPRSMISREFGEGFSGFFKKNFPIGIGKWQYPLRCASLNAKDADTLASLGRIGSIVIFKNGHVTRELLFHRLDGLELESSKHESLMHGTCLARNVQMTLPNTFGDAKWTNVCWICTQQDRMLLCCGECGIAMHANCAKSMLLSEEHCPYDNQHILRPLCDEDLNMMPSFKQVIQHRIPKIAEDHVVMESTEAKNLKRKKLQMHPEEQAALATAKRQGKKLSQELVAWQTRILKKQLFAQRNAEMARRREWSAQKVRKQEEHATLEQMLQDLQGNLVLQQLDLNRLQGQDLQKLKLPEISQIQERIELGLENCRQELETRFLQLTKSSTMYSALKTKVVMMETPEPKCIQRTPHNMIIIGLTGGIASGKSTVCKMLESELGATVLNADLLGHEAYLPGTECFQNLVNHFGDKIVGEDGMINRKVLGPIVFANPDEMKMLNAIVWPGIRKLVESHIAKLSESFVSSKTTPYGVVIVEAAVLIEAEWYDLVDETWVVLASPEIQTKRLMSRNQFSEADAQVRVASQISNVKRSEIAHVEIWNEDGEDALSASVTKQAASLRKRYGKLSAFEFITVVDTNDKVVMAAKRAMVKAFGLIYRASYTIVVHKPTQRIYVQKRSMQKDFGPGLLDPCPGGVLGMNESYEVNAQREMEEEMGLSDIKLKPLGKIYYDNGQFERCCGFVFTCEVSKPLDTFVLQESEVESISLMSIDEIKALPESQCMPDSLKAFHLFCEKRASL